MARLAAPASRDFRRAAVRLWRMPPDAALSRARFASRRPLTVASASPSATVWRTVLEAVFSAERTDLFRSCRRSF